MEHLKSRRISERRARRLTGFPRSAAWRPLKGRNDARLRSKLKRLAEQYPKYGCPTLHDTLVIEGEVVNKKRTGRIYCEEGLQVRTKKRKKLTRPRIPLLVPEAVNQRWSMDFVSDRLANCRRFRVLNIVDDFSCEYCLDLHWFASIEDARSTIDDWQHHYNHIRPHRSLGKKPLAVFAKEAA